MWGGHGSTIRPFYRLLIFMHSPFWSSSRLSSGLSYLLKRPGDDVDEVLGRERQRGQEREHEEDDGHGRLVDGDLHACSLFITQTQSKKI